MRSRDDRGIGNLPPPGEDAWELGLSGAKQATRHRRAERWLSTTRRAAGLLPPVPAASSYSDR